MSNFLKKMLGHNLFYSIKYSQLFYAYEKLFKPNSIKQQIKETQLYQSFLSDCNLIFDIGANDGHKTEAFLTVSNRIVCCEPDFDNFSLLQIRFRNRRNKVVLLNNAVSNKNGKAILHTHHGGSAFNTLNQKWVDLLETKGKEFWNEKIDFQSEQNVELTTLDSLIEQFGKPEFIKIDVEGSELQVLTGLSQKIDLISFECFIPEFKNELVDCIRHLQSLDSNTKYNIIVDEQIILKEYLDSDGLFDWLDSSKLKAFEILARTT